MPNWDPNNADVSEAWMMVSARYAAGASGQVRVIVGPGGIRPDSVFSLLELPTLLSNLDVTGIDYIYSKPLTAGMEICMELIWENRGLVKAKIGDREITVGGEAMLEGNPDFIVHAQYLKTWSDGTPLTEEERTELLDDLVEEASRRGWKFEIVW